MELTRLTITLAADERAALQAMARSEMRPLKDHIRYLLREQVHKAEQPTAHHPKEQASANPQT
jgi:hypothetical protein